MSDHIQFTPIPGPPTNASGRSSEPVLRPLWLAASFAVFVCLGWMLLAAFFQPRPEWFTGPGWRPQPLIYYLCLDGFALALSAAFLCGVDGRRFRMLGLWFDPGWIRHAVAGMAWGAGVVSGAVLLLFLARKADVFLFVSGSLSRLLFLAAFLVLSSAFEELMFRGYALQRAAEALGPVIAGLVSSALFGLAHSANPQATKFSTLNTALAGVFLAVARLRSRALWMPIGLHFAWNLFLGPVFSFPVSGYTFGAERLSAAGAGPLWFSGGAYGPEGSVALTVVLVVAIALLLRLPVPCPFQRSRSDVD